MHVGIGYVLFLLFQFHLCAVTAKKWLKDAKWQLLHSMAPLPIHGRPFFVLFKSTSVFIRTLLFKKKKYRLDLQSSGRDIKYHTELHDSTESDVNTQEAVSSASERWSARDCPESSVTF